MEKDPMVTEAISSHFLETQTKPPLHPLFMYLSASMLLAYLRTGGLTTEKQRSSQRAVIAFTEHFIRREMQHAQGDLPGIMDATDTHKLQKQL